MYKKKYQECITTSSPTPNVAVPGCYRAGRCNGYLYACCDCDMTENECENASAYWKTDCDDLCDIPVGGA